MKKSHFRFFKNKWVIISIILILIIAVVVYEETRPKALNFQYSTAAIGNVVEQVSVTGTVSSVSEADLAFEKGGVVTAIDVAVGDQVKAGNPIASLDSASDQAALASEQATLADMQRSLTPQELAVQQDDVASAQTTLANAQNDAVNAVHTALTQAQAALFDYSDTLFVSPQSVNPQIIIHSESSTQQNAINQERTDVTAVLGSWQSDLLTTSTSSVSRQFVDDQTYLAAIKSFMNDLSVIVNNLNPADSSLPQSTISTYASAMNSGLSNLNQAIGTITDAQTELTNAQSALDQAQSAYNLKLAGDSSDSIAAQAANVAEAQAALAEDTIVSPINGIVTQENPNVGEYIAPGQEGFAVQNSDFKVEAYVAEADIAKVAVGDLASSTLDAYGAYINFPEQVTAIDPAETVLEGVPTYKVTLQFVTPDSRIKSGMTSNLEILTHEADNVLEIPYRALTITSTSTMVNLVSANGQSYTVVPVEIGLKGSDGTVQIISGLKVGDKVVTYIGS